MIVISEYFYTHAQICLSGHINNSNVEHHPENENSFCQICGAKVIDECPSCHAKIRGERGCIKRNMLDNCFHFSTIQRLSIAPAYCYACGAPYPWTEATLKTAENIINMLDELTPEQKKQLVDFIPDIIVETPQSRYAALVYAKFLDGLQGLAVDCFKDWLKKNVLPTLLVLMNMQEQ